MENWKAARFIQEKMNEIEFVMIFLKKYGKKISKIISKIEVTEELSLDQSARYKK